MKKMSALGELAAKGRHDLAAIIVADVQDTLANFDPAYFPTYSQTTIRYLPRM